jgi:hypothetical protein
MDASVDRRTIWVDAICIDQSNPDERSQQVQLMGQIYRNAQRVLVWLGHSDAEFGGNFEFAVLMLEDNISLKPGLLADDVGKTFIKLLSTPWFTRTWIVQEVALAKSAIVLYGDTEIKWDRLVELCTKLQSVVSLTPQGNLLLSYLLGIERVRRMFQLGQLGLPIQPFNQLQLCRERLATDPRDKVYALLGLLNFAPRGENFTIIPDYREQNTKQAVYLDFAVKSLQMARTLDLFSVP